jgi:hypothetical protein|mmetsp:Transcript_56417/g.92758  ORF Transcript_56417/g.92758 Transcript_56417/m.92758 type:complete len:108 (+) Transcript_56417:463-786(+)
MTQPGVPDGTTLSQRTTLAAVQTRVSSGLVNTIPFGRLMWPVRIFTHETREVTQRPTLLSIGLEQGLANQMVEELEIQMVGISRKLLTEHAVAPFKVTTCTTLARIE